MQVPLQIIRDNNGCLGRQDGEQDEKHTHIQNSRNQPSILESGVPKIRDFKVALLNVVSLTK